MDRRSHESPMDFEWQTSGPADQSSPFHQLSVNYRVAQNESQAKKRTHGVFDSPTKTVPPALTEPVSQTYLFSRPPGAKPLPPFRNPSFTTPRKFELDLCSSGPEVSSPDNNADEDTPEPVSRKAPSKANGVTTMTQFVGSKSEKKPLVGQHDRLGGPGRGELRRGKYSDAIARKVRKRRRQEWDKGVAEARRDSWEEDSDSPTGTARSRSPSKQHRAPPASSGFISTFFAGVESHPALPHILSYYTQLALNLFLVFCFVYVIYSFWATIRSDVDKASDEARAEALADMAACAQQFVDNRCDRSNRVPAMEAVCNQWERCMNRDPGAVGRARVSARTFAEIFNSFVEPISYKAMVFCLAVAFSCIAGSNLAFALVRNKMSPPPSVYAQHAHQPPPSYAAQHDQGHQFQGYATPSHGMAGGGGGHAMALGMPMTTPRRKMSYH
ncbi:MAG: hypothetical protein M1832_000578 [Thelocarpon impressellum]|nr:MAG: hypothetical protein M1832_000578 [Thelocarpon impressellum]